VDLHRIIVPAASFAALGRPRSTWPAEHPLHPVPLAHLTIARINITPTILRKKIEDLRDARASNRLASSFDLLNRSDYAGIAYKDASGPRKG
jgi:hypothetical protein